MSRKVLVTGAHGFIGRHVARCFSNDGYHVTGIGHGVWRPDEKESYGVDCWYSSSISLERLAECLEAAYFDVIVHCAGSGSVPLSISNPYGDFVSSVNTTAALLEYARLYAPNSRLIYLSSGAVYGLVEELPILEGSPLKPLSPYGVHKLVCEQLCASYRQNFNLPVTIVRLFSIYGDGLEKQLLWDACKKLDSGDYCFSGTGAEVRDWLHVTDVATLILALSNNPRAELVVNGGAGAGISVKDILAMVFKAYSVLAEPKFTGVQRLGDPPGFQADNSIALASGWSPNVALSDGVREYVEWFISASSRVGGRNQVGE